MPLIIILIHVINVFEGGIPEYLPRCVMSPDAEGVDEQNDVYIHPTSIKIKYLFQSSISSYTSRIAYRVTLANEISFFGSFIEGIAFPLSPVLFLYHTIQRHNYMSRHQ